jgi:transposase InsO family protein
VTKLSFVSAERANHAVATLCRVVGVSVSGFHAWLRAIPALQTRAEAEAELRGQIGRVFAARRRVYGSPRVHAELRREGRRHSRRRVARLMREMGLSARRGRKRAPRTTDSRHDLPVAPNLLDRNFTAENRTRSGWRTSRISPPARASCTWLRSKTWPRARSSAGPWPITSGPGCASMRSSWRSGATARPRAA